MRQRRYCNRHQYAFLREVRNHPEGLPVDAWPATSTLKRWLHHDAFRQAIVGLIATFRLEAELFSASTAARAGQALQTILSGCDAESVEKHVKSVHALARVMRNDQVRHKENRPRPAAKAPAATSAATVPPPPPPTPEPARSPEAQRSRDRHQQLVRQCESLARPFPDVRRNTALWYNPMTDRREYPDVDVPAEIAGAGMDRLEQFIWEVAGRHPGSPPPERLQGEAPVKTAPSPPISNRPGDE